MYIFSFGSYSLGPLVSDRILTVRLATHDSVGRGQDDRWEAAVLRWVWRADDLYSLWYSSKWCLLMLGQVGPNIKSTALTWHEWAPNNKVTLCRGAQSHNLTAIAKLVFFTLVWLAILFAVLKIQLRDLYVSVWCIMSVLRIIPKTISDGA